MGTMDKIIQKFAATGYQIHPDAVKLIEQHNGSTKSMVQDILASLDESVLVIAPEHIRNVQQGLQPAINTTRQTTHITTAPEAIILSDVTDDSTCIGNYNEFVRYFRDRYARLGEIIRKRVSARPIETVNKGRQINGREDITIIGMVSGTRATPNGHRLVEMEDPTGTISVLFLKDKDAFEKSQRIILDEVIGITGSLTNDGGLLIANNIIWPEAPAKKNKPHKTGEPTYAVLISDVHIGSNMFLEETWSRFISWINSDVGNEQQQMLAERVKYLVIAGDLVDGIGIYPNQERELAILDIYEQYRLAAEHLSGVPSRIKVIIAPGNHDAVRQAEPQPALPKQITSMFKSPNITFVGNPSLIELNGTRILVYHGRALDDLVAALPDITYCKPDKAMIEMVKRRHLSPIYGGRVSIAPERSDHLIIDPVPDIIHCGHVHTVGVSKYRGVTLINSGTWQSQTEFQKRMNLEPVPGCASIVNLNTLETSILKFYT